MNLYNITDLFIAVAYFLISFEILYIQTKIKFTKEFNHLSICFQLFIVFCGIIHLNSFIEIWTYNSIAFFVIKLLTAIVSWYTVIIIVIYFNNILKVVKQTNTLQNQVENYKENLSVLFHEVKTPLNIMVGSIELLNMEIEDNEHLETLNNSVQSLEKLTGNILEDSVISLKDNNSTFKLGYFIKASYNNFYHQVKDKNIEFRYKFCTDVYKNLCTDKFKVEQVINNLVNNAIKFTDNGYIQLEFYNIEINEFNQWLESDYYTPNTKTITVCDSNRVTNFLGSERSQKPSSDSEASDLKMVTGCINIDINSDIYYLVIKVKDSGIGINSKDYSKIFKKYGQLDIASTRTNKGLGLGLNICINILDSLNGNIYVRSKNGTEFLIKIPIKYINPIKLSKMDEYVVIYEKSSDIENTKNTNILIADDNEVNLKVIVNMLNKLGYHNIITFDNGENIYEHCKTDSNVDIILMDIHMPVMDGKESVSNIRKILHHRNTIIFAFTASIYNKHEMDDLLNQGFTDILPKPLRINELKNTMNKYI